MFRIENNRDCFYQWDLNQRLIVDGLNEGDEVHFSSDRDNDPNAAVLRVFTENETHLVNVPNIFLQSDGIIHVYGYVREEDSGYTEKHEMFYVLKREKPADYVYTETEVLTWENLDSRITNLENNAGGIDVAGATPGQTIEIFAVDEQGRPTEWQAVDFPKGLPATDSETIAVLAENDMLPAVYNTDGKILTDENGKIILRY